MRMKVLSVMLGMGLALGSVGAAFAQGGSTAQTPLPFASGCNVNPINTADPVAVAQAQRAVAAFYAEQSRTFSRAGYTNLATALATEGNAQTEWYNKTLALACGRLIGGYQGMNWVPGRGWEFAR